jgi:chromate transporter
MSGVPAAHNVSTAHSVSTWRLLRAFLGIAITTFGSSQSAAIQRQIVRVHGWMSIEEFTTLRGLALVVPGPNSPNLAVLVGQRLGGTSGAVAAYFASTVPGIVIALLLGALSLDPRNHVVSAALRGATAAAVGIIGANALEMTVLYRKRALPLVLCLATLLAVLVGHFSLWLTLAIFLPVSIALMRPARAARS